MTGPRTVAELHRVVERIAAIAAESEALADAVDRARFQLRPTDELVLAVDLHSALTAALDLDLDLDRALARGLDRARYLSRDLDLTLSRAVKRARSLEHVLDLEDEFEDEVQDALYELEDEPNPARDLARLVVRFPARSLALKVRFTVYAAAASLPLDHAHLSAWRVRDAVSTLQARTWTLLAEAQSSADDAGPAAVVVPAAQRVLELALRIVGVNKRSRYREEFYGELHALAAVRASGRAQLAHACVLARRVWALQRALRTPQPTEERAR